MFDKIYRAIQKKITHQYCENLNLHNIFLLYFRFELKDPVIFFIKHITNAMHQDFFFLVKTLQCYDFW